MSNNNSKLSMEIDGGKFFLWLFNIIFIIGAICFLVWFNKNVYQPEKIEYIKLSRYAYKAIQSEVTTVFRENGYVFNPDIKNDDTLCQKLISKYAQNGSGSCSGFNPISAELNFVFKNKKLSVYGLEKPLFDVSGSKVKDIIIDVNGEDKGENQVGIDRTIIRIYSSGRAAGIITPVNCSSGDEKDYGLKKSFYCIGSQEINYLTTDTPLAFDIEQIGGDNGKTRTVGKRLPFLRADCSVFSGEIINADDYCSEKMLYQLRSCDDEYVCNITISKY